MKNIGLITILGSVLFLMACQPSTSKTEAVHEQQELSTNNKKDIQADMLAIEAIESDAQHKAQELQLRLNQTRQLADYSKTKTVLSETNIFTQQTIEKLQRLQLKSEEVSQLRKQMIELSQLGIEINHILIESSGEPNPNTIEPLIEKLHMQQKTLSRLNLNIENKLQAH